MFSLICAWINGWVNNREAGELRRHCAHYDVTVMNATAMNFILQRVFDKSVQIHDEMYFHLLHVANILVHAIWYKLLASYVLSSLSLKIYRCSALNWLYHKMIPESFENICKWIQSYLSILSIESRSYLNMFPHLMVQSLSTNMLWWKLQAPPHPPTPTPPPPPHNPTPPTPPPPHPPHPPTPTPPICWLQTGVQCLTNG